MIPPNHDQVPAQRLHDRTAAVVKLAGYATRDPIVVGVQQGNVPPSFFTSGRTAAGEPLTTGTVVYTASLSKHAPSSTTRGPSTSARTRVAGSTGTAAAGPG